MNGFNNSVERQRLCMNKKQDPTIYCLYEVCFRFQYATRLKVKTQEKKTYQHKEQPLLTLDNTDFIFLFLF